MTPAALLEMAELREKLVAMTAERDRLQAILDGRPAINAALPDSYIKWSQNIYVLEALHASKGVVQ